MVNEVETVLNSRRRYEFRTVSTSFTTYILFEIIMFEKCHHVGVSLISFEKKVNEN